MMPSIGPGVITALATLLALIGRIGAERRDRLVMLVSRTSLRGGALPFKAGLELGKRLQLIEEREDEIIDLTSTGAELFTLVGDEPEPSDAFRELVACLALTAAPIRALSATVHARPDTVDLRRVDGDLLMTWLESVGLAKHVDTTWTLVGLGRILAIGPLADAEDSPNTRTEYGVRGEELSLRHEAERLGRSGIAIRVSRISDAFGFDVLSRSTPETVTHEIGIEVKACRSGQRLDLFMTSHEVTVAHRLGDRYWLHAWGDIRLEEKLDEQYSRLRRLGYPIVIQHVTEALGKSALELLESQKTPAGWPVRASEIRLTLPAPDVGGPVL
jgi:hypothetical protein